MYIRVLWRMHHLRDKILVPSSVPEFPMRAAIHQKIREMVDIRASWTRTREAQIPDKQAEMDSVIAEFDAGGGSIAAVTREPLTFLLTVSNCNVTAEWWTMMDRARANVHTYVLFAKQLRRLCGLPT